MFIEERFEQTVGRIDMPVIGIVGLLILAAAGLWGGLQIARSLQHRSAPIRALIPIFVLIYLGALLGLALLVASVFS